MLPISFLSLLVLSCQTAEYSTSAYQMTSLNQRIGGDKSLAQPGDFMMENAHVRFSIIGKRASMGPHTFGGGVIDADIQRNDPSFNQGHGQDLLAEVFPTISMNVAWIDEEHGNVEIIQDGSNGEAVICTVGRAYPFISLLQVIWGVGGKLIKEDLGYEEETSLLPYSIRTDYTLGVNDKFLRMRTYLIPDGEADCMTDITEAESFVDAYTFVEGDQAGRSLIDIALADGYMAGDFYLQGGSLNVFTPGIGFDENGHVFDLNNDGINTFVEPIAADFISGTGKNISYSIISPLSKLYVPLFTSGQTAAFGGAYLSEDMDEDGIYYYDRYLAVGQGDVGSSLDGVFESLNETQKVSGFVVEKGTGVSISGAHVMIYQTGEEAPWLEWQTDIGMDNNIDGSFEGLLPYGEYEIQVHKRERPQSDRYPLVVDANGMTLNGKKITGELVLSLPQPGSIHINVVDETERLVPSKITIFSTEGLDLRNEVLGDGYIPTDIEWGPAVDIIFAAHGQSNIVLPPGEYIAVATRGLEYEIDISEPFTITGQNHTQLELQVLRTVDTTGWISADFHVHSKPSHDSGVSYHKRVATMACEGVEYFTPTDHDYISDMDPTIEDMGLEFWINSAPGSEVTTIEIGHYLSFPLQVNHLDDSGGAIDWTGMTPDEIVGDLKKMGQSDVGEPTIYIGHPRDGILGYFDQFGVNAFGQDDDLTVEGNLINGAGLGSLSGLVTGFTDYGALINSELLKEENFSTDVDAIEILNGKRFELLRTPTTREMKEYNDAMALATSLEERAAISSEYSQMINSRTLEEQQELIEQAAELRETCDITDDNLESDFFTLSSLSRGTIDDWFMLLNHGYKMTALGNSDTHGTTKVEAGCPRNYIMVDGDEPIELDDDEISQAVKDGKVLATYGPFVRFYANGNPSITMGSTTSGESVELSIEVQAPSWYDVSSLEIYRNGTLIDVKEIPDNDEIIKYEFSETYDVEIRDGTPIDSWFVAIVQGTDSLSPLFTTTERPAIQLQDVVAEALGDASNSTLALLSSFLSPIPIPRAFPTYPYALTNPIWINVDGEGDFEAPGVPEWLIAPPTDGGCPQ